MTGPSRRRLVLAALAGGVLLSGPARALMPGAQAPVVGTPACTAAAGLAQLGCGKGILFGTAAASNVLAEDPAYAALVKRECALLVPEWEMKWAQVQKSPGVFTFDHCDRLARFAREAGMVMRGHTLVWYQNMPDWLARGLRPTNWEQSLRDHMAQLVTRYRDQVRSWDVVNEALEPEHGRGDGLRNSPWLKAAGPAYVGQAFKIAAEFAPGAELAYNDYGLEHDDEWCRKRRTACLKLLERLKGEGAPVHALGLQSHLRVGDRFDPDALARFLGEVQAMGIKPLVTEFHVRGDRLPDPQSMDRETAALGGAFLDVMLGQSNCDTVVCWGLSDRYSWRLQDNPRERPNPFDHARRKKPLYDAMAAAFARSAPRSS